VLCERVQTALSSLASAITRCRQVESQVELSASRDGGNVAAEDVAMLRQELQIARREASNTEASYAAERDGHSAAVQELTLLQNHIRRCVAT